jgi:hypothetical protein
MRFVRYTSIGVIRNFDLKEFFFRFGVEIAIRELKSYKSPGTVRIPAELVKAGGETYVLRYTNFLFYME